MKQVLSKRLEVTNTMFPEIQAVIDHWNKLQKLQKLPVWRDFEFLDLPVTLIPHIVIVDIQHTTFHGYDFTNKLASSLIPAPYRDLIINQYIKAAKIEVPILFAQQIPLNSGCWVHTELLRLPFSDDGETINKIISVELAHDDFGDVQKYFAGDDEDIDG
jgi:hypothetical protein